MSGLIIDWKVRNLRDDRREFFRRTRSAAAALILITLLGCAPAVESQDEVNLPPPTTIVDADFVDYNGGTATGELIVLTGSVVNGQGQPLPEAVVYIRQTDAYGRYRVQAERADAVDPHFRYEGWIKTDERGRFELRTVAPGAYISSRSQIPHIHIQARHGELRSLYHTIAFPQYPPRNGSRDYLQRDDKWIVIVDLKSEGDGVKSGEFRLIAR